MNDPVQVELIAIGLQTVVLLIALLATVRYNERRITSVEKDVERLHDEVKPIPGLSRTLSRIEGQLINYTNRDTGRS